MKRIFCLMLLTILLFSGCQSHTDKHTISESDFKITNIINENEIIIGSTEDEVSIALNGLKGELLQKLSDNCNQYTYKLDDTSILFVDYYDKKVIGFRLVPDDTKILTPMLKLSNGISFVSHKKDFEEIYGKSKDGIYFYNLDSKEEYVTSDIQEEQKFLTSNRNYLFINVAYDSDKTVCSISIGNYLAAKYDYYNVFF